LLIRFRRETESPNQVQSHTWFGLFIWKGGDTVCRCFDHGQSFFCLSTDETSTAIQLKGGRFTMKKYVNLLTVAFLILFISTAAFANDNVDFWLTVLHNNDGESELLPVPVLDEADNVIGTQGGVAQFATVRKKTQLEALRASKRGGAKRGVIFVSSGDNFLASPAFTASLNDGIFYDALALDKLRYDAIALGNHDFDFGPDLLADFISEGFKRPGRPPYLSSNLDFSNEPALQVLFGNGIIAKSTIIRARGKWIGIIGATTENLPFISSPRNVIVNAVLPAVQAEVDALEARGINMIVLISHLQDVDGDVALAEQLTGVDVMIAGGGDELLANPGDLLLPSDDPGDIFGPYPVIAEDVEGNEVPVVTTSGQYGYLGSLTVGFDEDGIVRKIDYANSRPIRVVSKEFPDGVRPSPWFEIKVEAPVAAFVADLAANVIANSEVDLDGRRDSVRFEETNEGDLIADSQLWQARLVAAEFGAPEPDVALQNGGGIRNDSIIPAGEITELDTFDMVPFPNFVTVVPDIPRSQFKEILENAVSRTQPGDTPGGTGRFAQVAGFSFVYSASGIAQVLNPDGTVAVAGTRIQSVVLDDGTPIVASGAVVTGDPINIAIVDFLARGGDQYPFRGAPFTVLGVSYQQALFNYIVGPLNGEISAADYPEGGEGRITVTP
jgi:5'-nucleotidase